MQAQMLAPAAVLVVWTLIVMFWMAGTRLPAIARSGGLSGKPGGRGVDLEGVLDDRINWKSHNYTHLLEQPTLFYATSLIVAIMGAGALDVTLAWVYVAIRIVHSVWQALVNTIPVRLTLFFLSTICLVVLAVRALMLTLFTNSAVVS